MASATFGQRFRVAVGDPGTVFTDPEIDDFGDQAEEAYPGASMRVHVTYAAMLAIRSLMANKAKQVSYSQNSASENLSDMIPNLGRVYNLLKDELSDALEESGGGGIHFGSLSKFPTRRKEYPDA